MNWLIENKEWFLSGAGIFALGIILQIFSKGKKSSIFSIKSGDNCINTQVNKKERQGCPRHDK